MGGYYYKPHLVKEIQNENGAIVSSNDKELVKMSVSTETSDFIKNAMYLTVEEGTASGAQVSGYKVGGKTGTAQKFPRAAKTYLVSFIGMVPADNPEIVIYTVIDEPQNVVTQANSSIATKFSSSVLKDILPFLQIYPTEEGDEQTQINTDIVLPSTDNEDSQKQEDLNGDLTVEEGDQNKESGTNEDSQNETVTTEDNKNETSLTSDLEGTAGDDEDFNPDAISDTTEEEQPASENN